MSKPTRITSIQFSQFKALCRYNLSLEHLNVLVGPNNSGKSTIIGSVRALAAGLKVARTRAPDRLTFGNRRMIGYRVAESSLPISLENVHTDYSSGDATVTFSINNGNSLHLVFPGAEGCFLIPEVPGFPVTSAALFRRHFPITLTVVPVLGPVEHREERRERDTVVAGLSTHRASRHFRSYWHYFQDEFEPFAELVKQTWPGMEIQRPEIDHRSGELSMFCLEHRMTRELYWSGFGFQIWCQLLTHLSRSHDSSLVVIDEPEVYLHPDVQRQLIGILRDLGPDVLLATHSTEIMAEADPSDIVLVDKHKTTAERLRNVVGVQRAMDAVGSVQNITLTALARNRRVLFVEGDADFNLLRRFARKLGLAEFGAGFGITPLSSGGFGSWQKITTLASGIGQALGTQLLIGVVYDRDYFCDEEISSVVNQLATTLSLAHVHQRKEIENYLLVPAVLDRAIARLVADRCSRGGRQPIAVPTAVSLLRDITDPMKVEVQSQLVARRCTFLRHSGIDLATLTGETLTSSSTQWEDLASRLVMVPGKEVLASLRERVHGLLGVTLTSAKIVDAFHRDEVAPDLEGLLTRIEAFRTGT